MRRALCVVGLLNLSVVASLAAQQLKPMFVRWEAPGTSLSRTLIWSGNQRDTVLVPRRDYRYEGLAFGGIVFGALGAWIGSRISEACPTVPGARCKPDRLGNAVALGLAGAAAGGGLGYLVGRLSSKPPSVPRPAAESFRPP